MIPDYVSVVN